MGAIIRFPGRTAGVPSLLPSHAEHYRHTVYRMPVQQVGSTWHPYPEEHWAPVQFLQWQLGAIAGLSRTATPIHLRTHKPSSGPYALQIGHLQPITGLTVERASDILAGVHSALLWLDSQL